MLSGGNQCKPQQQPVCPQRSSERGTRGCCCLLPSSFPSLLPAGPSASFQVLFLPPILSPVPPGQLNPIVWCWCVLGCAHIQGGREGGSWGPLELLGDAVLVFPLTALCWEPCQNGGSCAFPGRCSCPPGWTGRACQTGTGHVPPVPAAWVTRALLLLLGELLLGASQLPWGSECPLPSSVGTGTSAVAPIRPWAMSGAVPLHTRAHLLQERMGSVAPRGVLTPPLAAPVLPALLCSCGTPIFSACCSVLGRCEQSCEQASKSLSAAQSPCGAGLRSCVRDHPSQAL